ncbi:hypothetical protein AMS68_000703 [Peltaster fructicola]|uniref:Glycoside hydrolase family 1 protein n=1 Tax=Peltaster fructicola TaxID=286661 RepID=A0A6H0XKF6_9PEZI|nr:hypothetical protein AMS68_000703 [Peltaster fructicola]
MVAVLCLLFASLAVAQLSNSSTPRNTTLSGTPAANPTAYATSLNIDVEDLWDIFIGPVAEASITTTVAATPVPSQSLVPPPPLYYSPFPAGQQIPLASKNESWSFPKDFWRGVAGAAYQVEGAAKDQGRGPSVWDRLSRIPNYVVNNQTADITDNHYYLYKNDIARIAAIGVDTYSFTLSWSRILPFGRGAVNQLAIDHYNDVINTCLQYNITPVITLYHWDTPLYLQTLYGGWLSEEIVGDFVEYSRIAFAAFGDRVSVWFTVNEPIVFCNQYPFPSNYFKNFSIPNLQQPWYCGQSVLLAHSQAYHLGKSMMPNAQIAYKNNGGYKIPLTNSTADAQAVQRAWDFNEGWFSDPIYLTGDYPQSVKTFVSQFLRSLTEEEKQSILGSADFYAHDAYTSNFYSAPDSGLAACINSSSNPLYPACVNSTYTYSPQDGSWLIGPSADPGSPWLHRATDWVPVFLHYIQDTWVTPSPGPAKNGGIAVTEFGFSEPFEEQKTLLQDILTDPIRSSYYQDYMQALLIAMSEGVKIIGSVAWSFVDNYEWSQGTGTKFGMQYVNFSDPTLPRYYKASFFTYINAFDIYQQK